MPGPFVPNVVGHLFAFDAWGASEDILRKVARAGPVSPRPKNLIMIGIGGGFSPRYGDRCYRSVTAAQRDNNGGIRVARTNAAAPKNPPSVGPSIAAIALWGSSGAKRISLLTDEERAELVVISSIARFKKGEKIYRQGDRANAVFNIVSGVVRTCKVPRRGARHITAFLFPDDLFGLAEEGRYVNDAEAMTAVTLYRIPVAGLETKLRREPTLEFHVICKLCHELREAQRHAFILSKRRALAKMALFLQLMDNHQAAIGDDREEVYFPMSRSDVGNYVGMSSEAVTRSLNVLSSRGLIRIRDRRHVRILDHTALEGVAAERGVRGLSRYTR